MGHPRTEHTPRVPAVSLHLSIASKKPNEMQVCGSDSRDKLNFAVNNIFKRNSFASIFYFTVTNFLPQSYGWESSACP